jgi:Ca-activated chloride channel family protein
MARWPTTIALSVTAAAALFAAPRLQGQLTQPPIPDIPIPVPPVPLEVAQPDGSLKVSAGLDRDAVMVGSGETRFLAITITAPEAEGLEVDWPVDLAVVIDASGSMAARGKIDYARRAAKMLASSLDADDRFSLVTFSDGARTLIPATPVTNIEALHHAIDGIYEGGGTNLYAGLEQGGQQVERSMAPGMVGRVVVLSDGHANVGLVDAASFEQLSATQAAQGVTISALGLGRDYNEDLLARMADLGGGAYEYVDDPSELASVLAAELKHTASVVARGVNVKVELPSEIEGIEVLGWDASPTASGWNIWMGDMYAGETRKVIAQVRVRAGTEGLMPVAAVRADYHDLLSDTVAQSSATAQANATRNQRLASRSTNRERSVQSQQAYGAWYLDQSARSFQSGDRTAARRLADEGRQVMRKAAIDFADDDLDATAELLQTLASVAETTERNSYEGKGALKAMKEESRVLSR